MRLINLPGSLLPGLICPGSTARNSNRISSDWIWFENTNCTDRDTREGLFKPNGMLGLVLCIFTGLPSQQSDLPRSTSNIENSVDVVLVKDVKKLVFIEACSLALIPNIFGPDLSSFPISILIWYTSCTNPKRSCTKNTINSLSHFERVFQRNEEQTERINQVCVGR